MEAKPAVDPELKDGRGIRALSLRQIEVFHAVFVTRSITAASRLLQVSQPTLSRTVKRIEDILSVVLFHRTGTGLMPTVEAQLIFEEVDGLMRRLDGLGARIEQIASGGAVPFRTGATASVARGLVPRALSKIAKASTETELFLDVLPVDQIGEYLLAGTGQCVVTMATIDHPMLSSAVLGQGRLVAVVPIGHPLAKCDELQATELDGVDVISFQVDGPHQRAIRRFLDPAQVKPHSRAVVRFADTAVALASEGLGIALVDSFTTMGPVGNGVVLVPLKNGPQFDVHIQWNPNRPGSDHMRQFREEVEALLGASNGGDMP
jgi:DNA-binding transcriptional LysR family regulator